MSMARLHTWESIATDHPMEKIERRRIIGDRMMISQVRWTAGFDLVSHRHDNEQHVIMLSGHCVFGLGESGTAEYREIEVRGGQVLELPGNVWHSCRALEDSVIYDDFSPVSETTGVDRH
jgi:quercetin dioxygenase-like cupin family protein